MAAPYKTGLEYFPFEFKFFRDKDIKRLKGEFGAKGIVVLLFVWRAVYEDEGYFLRWEDDDCFYMSEDIGCGCTPDLVREVIQRCVKCGIFDQTVFNMFSVLTSRKIQLNFQQVSKSRVQKRANKTPVEVDGKLWVLKKNETESCIKVCFENDTDRNNPYYSMEEPSNSKEEPPKGEEKRGEDIRGEERAAEPPPPPPTANNPQKRYGEYSNVLLTDDEYSKLADKYGIKNVAKYIEKVDRHVQKNRKKPYLDYYATLDSWMDKDGITKPHETSYDLDKMMEYDRQIHEILKND